MKAKRFLIILLAFAYCFAAFAGCKDDSDSHSHEYCEYVTSETSHWKECDCGEKKEEGEHTPGDWVITKQATHLEKGIKQKKCSVCGYVTAWENIDKLTEHTFDKQVETDAYCFDTNTDLGEKRYYYSCECGQSENNPEHYFTANIPHSHTFDADVWNHDDEEHWHPATCEHTVVKGNPEQHSLPLTWSEKSETEHSKECSVCHYEKTETHNYTEEIHEKAYIKEYATVDSPAEYYYSCVCGKNEHNDEHTFKYGSVHVHDYTEDGYNTTHHYKYCLDDDAIDESSKEEHTYDEENGWVQTRPATYGLEGEESNTCQDCAYTKTRSIPKLVDNAYSKFEVVYEGTATADYEVKNIGYYIKITNSDGADCHVKFQTNYATVKGGLYEIKFVFTSTETGSDKVKLEIGSGAKKFGGKDYFDVSSSGNNEVSGIFMATGDTTYINIQLGRLATNTEINITEVLINRLNPGNDCTGVQRATFTAVDPTNTNKIQTTVNTADKLQIKIVAPADPDNGEIHDWCTRVCYTTGITLQANTDYYVVMTLSAERANNKYFCMFYRAGAGWGGAEIAKQDSIGGNLAEIKNRNTACELNIWFQVGELSVNDVVTMEGLAVITPDADLTNAARVIDYRAIPQA